MSDVYVKPPKRNDDYIKPPSNKGDYVNPPKNVSEAKDNDYIKPPKSNNFKNTTQITTKKEAQNQSDNSKYVDPYDNPSFFGTPKVGIRFYINSYLIISIFIIISAISKKTSRGIFYLLYFLLTNYTYSWFRDYKRYKGEMLWLFQPYGTLKFASAASLFMDNRKGKIKKDMFGNLREESSRSVSKTFLSFIIILIVTEIIKYFINFIVALVSVFIHKSTIRKYNQAVDEDMNN